MSITSAPMALEYRKQKLVARRQEAFEEYKKKTAAIDAEIADIDRAIAKVNEALQDFLCPVCKGHGDKRVYDAAGQMESVPCDACHGTGIKI